MGSRQNPTKKEVLEREQYKYTTVLIFNYLVFEITKNNFTPLVEIKSCGFFVLKIRNEESAFDRVSNCAESWGAIRNWSYIQKRLLSQDRECSLLLKTIAHFESRVWRNRIGTELEASFLSSSSTSASRSYENFQQRLTINIYTRQPCL